MADIREEFQRQQQEEQQQKSDDEANDFKESSLRKLRQRWELASVLNFCSVFQPLIGDELKIPAEEIENALINPNASLAKLHVALLKGIPPAEKKKLSSEPGAWVTSLCRKLARWWPLIAEGEPPLTVAKGEEISRYKELDPTIRLLMLKALCELRAEQHDLASYINHSLKEGAQISQFRKDKIGQDTNGVSYWYDANSFIGHRLYMEVSTGSLKQKHRGKNCLDLQNTSLKWETLATNLDEFRKVLENLSSSQAGVEAAVHEIIESEVIPVLEKIQKKKERDLKRRQREEALLSGSHSNLTGLTRSCRTRGPVKYTFDEFDRTIDEAIKETRKRKDRKVERNDGKLRTHGKRVAGASNGDSRFGAHNDEEPPASTSEVEQDSQQVEGSDNDGENAQQGKDSENDEDVQQSKESEIIEEDDLQSEGSDKDNNTNCTDKSDFEAVSDSYSSDLEPDNVEPDGTNCIKLSHQQRSDNDASGLQMKRKSDPTSGQNLHRARSPEAKNRYRQRPTRNSAFESVVPDSGNDSSSENLSGDSSTEGEPYEVADSEDEISH